MREWASLLRAEGGEERRSQQKEERHARAEPIARNWHVTNPCRVRARNARWSPPLATKRSDSTSPSESARRQSCEGGPMARQVEPTRSEQFRSASRSQARSSRV